MAGEHLAHLMGESMSEEKEYETIGELALALTEWLKNCTDEERAEFYRVQAEASAKLEAEWGDDWDDAEFQIETPQKH